MPTAFSQAWRARWPLRHRRVQQILSAATTSLTLDPPFVPARRAELVSDHAPTVGAMFLARVDRSGHRTAFRAKHDGIWRTTSWNQFARAAHSVGCWLMDQELGAGDKVCIVGATCPEWCIADVAGQLAGCVTLGAYPTLAPAQLAYILRHSDARVAFVGGREEIEKIHAAADALPELTHIVVWRTDDIGDLRARDPRVLTFSEVLATPSDRRRVEQRVQTIDPRTPAIIVYTSGTTGPPKGAMISHRNIQVCLQSQEHTSPFDEDDVSFSFLPMAHVAERVLGFYGRINAGIATAFASSLSRVLEEVQEVRPTLFGSVPRIFEKAYGRIRSQLETAPPARRRVFAWAEQVGRRVVDHWQAGEPIPRSLALQYRVADRLVFARVRGAFGGRVRQFVTGAAPIAPEILSFFWAAGFPIFEVYGMTEATVLTHANVPGACRLGTVGRALDYVDDRLAEDGEVLVRGETVFLGYYKNAEATDQAIDAEGWLHTGDIGRKDADGFLTILDRKKHIIITAGGKNLTPANIENEIKAADPLISQAHAHGDRRPYLTALVTIGASEAIAYARERAIITADESARLMEALLENPLGQPGWRR